MFDDLQNTEDPKLNYQQIEMIISKRDIFKRLFEIFKITTPTTPLGQILKDIKVRYQKEIATYNEGVTICQWLQNRRVILSLDNPIEPTTKSLLEIRDASQMIQAVLRFPSPETYLQLLFLITKESIIFENLIRSELQKNMEVDLRRIENAVKQTTNFFEKILLSNELKVIDVQGAFEAFISVRYQNLTQELNSAAEFMNKMTAANINLIKENIQNTVQFLQYASNLESVIQCLRSFDLATHEELDRLGEIEHQISTKQVPICQVKNHLDTIQKYLPKIQGFQLGLFQVAIESEEVVRFLRTIRDFEADLDRASQLNQGFQMALDILNALVVSKRVLSPFINTIQPLPALCKEISKNFGTIPEEFNRQIGQICLVNDHLDRIKVWFSNQDNAGISIDTVLPWISLFMQTGRFQSRPKLHKDGVGLAFMFKRDVTQNDSQELPKANLQDLLNGVAIFIMPDAKQNLNQSHQNVQKLTDFIEVNRLANEIHEALVRLEEMGYPFETTLEQKI